MISMSISINHQISRYYDFFRDREIVFTKANLQTLKMDPRQFNIKCGSQFPCLINSSSLQSAKIIIGTESAAYNAITTNKDVPLSIKYCFLNGNNQPIYIYVNCALDEIIPYHGSKELSLISLNFTQRPPDDLIHKFGEFIEANDNFTSRKEDRIEINANSLRKLGIEKEESIIYIDQVPRRSILKDLSFNGAKIMLVGVPKFLVGKPIRIKIDFLETNDQVLIDGIVQNADFLEGRKDIVCANISYIAEKVPMIYKIHINNYISTYSKSILAQKIVNEQNASLRKEIPINTALSSSEDLNK